MLIDEVNIDTFKALNEAIIKAFKRNPTLAKIKAFGEFEAFLESANSVKVTGNTFIKYTVPYAPSIDVGKKPYNPNFRGIYDWVGLKKYGISYSTQQERKGIAWAIYNKHKQKGSFKFRNPSQRTDMINQSLDQAVKEWLPTLTFDRTQSVASQVQQEIKEINELWQ